AGTSSAGATAIAALGVTNVITGFTITDPGSGYTTNPNVTINPNGPGSGAQATAVIGRGTHYGKVWLLTSLVETLTGARAMTQSEVVTPVLGYSPGGALTLDGPNPVIGTVPNSSQFVIDGNDLHSCGTPAGGPYPAIDGYDDPNASPPTTS